MASLKCILREAQVNLTVPLRVGLEHTVVVRVKCIVKYSHTYDTQMMLTYILVVSRTVVTIAPYR